uniref:Uncharacterized protein n=1 Tax=Arundo donax TaxID=35708 RepID=A0A0A9FVI1_ARUDO
MEMSRQRRLASISRRCRRAQSWRARRRPRVSSAARHLGARRCAGGSAAAAAGRRSSSTAARRRRTTPLSGA